MFIYDLYTYIYAYMICMYTIYIYTYCVCIPFMIFCVFTGYHWSHPTPEHLLRLQDIDIGSYSPCWVKSTC